MPVGCGSPSRSVPRRLGARRLFTCPDGGHGGGTRLVDGGEGLRCGGARMMKSSLHSEEDDFVPELQRSIHPRERPDWEETLSAMARGADIPDITGELPLRTCSSTASMKVKNVKK